ncbi:TPA: hypothetical protein RUV27_001453 [Staphylococcus aureus]|nr:hypothetical protein [Staphylococcus aureus]
MSKHIYACLLGEWVNLSESENVVIDNSYTDANLWYKEVGHKTFDYNQMHIGYNGIDYFIHPSFIQVLTK